MLLEYVAREHISGRFFILKKILGIKHYTAKETAIIGMLVACTVILGYISGFLRVGNISKLSISFIPVYIAGALFGPMSAGIVGGLADFISYISNPTGVYLWQLTIIEILYGFMFGFIFYRKENITYKIGKLNLKILIFSVLQFVCNMILKTLILMNVGYVPGDFIVALGTRFLGCVIAVILNFAVINFLERYMQKIITIARK